jgi:hypothetical protein
MLLSCVYAGDTAAYTVRVSNTGPVRLKSLDLTVPDWATIINCTCNGVTASATGTYTIEPHKALVCHAEYEFSQDVYEHGPLHFEASAVSTELPAGVTSAPATITPSYTLMLEFSQGECTLPNTARKCGWHKWASSSSPVTPDMAAVQALRMWLWQLCQAVLVQSESCLISLLQMTVVHSTLVEQQHHLWVVAWSLRCGCLINCNT